MDNTPSTNASNEDSVVLSEKTLPSISTSLSISVDDLSADPVLSVRQPDGAEVNISAEIAGFIAKYGYDLIRESNKKRSILRLLENHPLLFTENLIEERAGYRSRLIHKDGDPDAEGVPVLSWKQKFVDTEEGFPDPIDRWEGWSLSIGSTEIGSALWSDVDGIKRLIDSMENSDSLKVTVALIDPKNSALMASRATLLSLYRNRELPSISILEVRRLIVEKGLAGKSISRRVDHAGHLSIFNMLVGEANIPVAVGVLPPTLLSITGSNKVGLPAIHYAKNEWLNRFAKEIEGSQEWRIVDIKLIDDRNFTWVTKISEADWAKIDLAVKNQASMLIPNTSVKF